MVKLGKNLRERVFARSRQRCAYCLSRQELMSDRLQIDHIIPKALGGNSDDENLCLACSSCNRFKASKLYARDPRTKTPVRIYNPNQQKWFENFRWNKDGTRIIGLTPCGRATIVALQLNNPWIMRVRSFWVSAKEHPPIE